MNNFYVYKEVQEKRIKMMGSNISIKIYGPYDSSLLDRCEEKLYDYNKIFSIYDKEAELYQLNMTPKNKETKVSKELFDLIEVGTYHSRQKDSNLNIFIGPLVKLWNIGFDNARIPSNKEIKEALFYTDPAKIKLNKKNLTVSFLEDRMEIDLGALAKGYISDKLLDYLDSKGVQTAIVNLGGNIKTLGLALHNPDFNFHIGLQDPRKPRGQHLLKLAINDMSIVTSGTYVRNFTEDKKTFHHILDPKTGYPIESDMTSISVISKSSLDGEVWTSRLFGKDFVTIQKECKNNPKIDIIVINKENQVNYTPGVEKYILRKDY